MGELEAQVTTDPKAQLDLKTSTIGNEMKKMNSGQQALDLLVDKPK